MCLTRKQQHQRQDQLELRYSCLQTVTITTPFNSVPICIIIKNCTCQVHIRSSALSVVQLVDPFFDGFKVVNSPVLIRRHTHLNIIITYIPLNSQINSNPDAQKKNITWPSGRIIGGSTNKSSRYRPGQRMITRPLSPV